MSRYMDLAMLNAYNIMYIYIAYPCMHDVHHIVDMKRPNLICWYSYITRTGVCPSLDPPSCVFSITLEQLFTELLRTMVPTKASKQTQNLGAPNCQKRRRGDNYSQNSLIWHPALWNDQLYCLIHVTLGRFLSLFSLVGQKCMHVDRLWWTIRVKLVKFMIWSHSSGMCK